MDLHLKNDAEHIRDLEGDKLQADAANLLKALDKLLTLGAYYSTGHEQYRQASQKAARTIQQAISPRKSMVLEITSNGVLILEQKIDPRHRNLRQLHDLLVPLNIARLEFDALVTAADLRQALAAFNDAKLDLSQCESFHEVVVKGLPGTIRTDVKSVQQAGDSSWDGENGPGNLGEMLGALGGMEAETVSEKLAREFMDLVNQIMANLESVMVSEAGLELPEGKTGVTRQEIQALREGLERLVEINPSPQQLLQLIEHARNALELSVDMSRTDLVFNILRKEMQTESDWQGSMKPAKARELEFGMTEDQLVSALQNLEADATRIDDPSWRSDVDHLQMCLELLGTEPNAALRHSIEDSLAALLGRPETRRESLGPISMAVMSQLQRGSAELVNPLVASVTLALRKGRPAFLGDFWMTLKSEGQAEDLTLLWPHLINDILLGLDEVDRDLRAQLLIWAGSLPPDVAPAQIPRLLEQPALEKGRCAADLFQVSLPEVHVVLRTLAATPLAAWLGRSLHAKLKARPFNKLVGSLMKVMVQYQPANLEFYLDLIAESDPRELPELLKERAVALLMGVLSDMPRSRRRERWVAVAVESLRELDCPLAGPLLDQVVSSKRLLFFPDWPEACRNAAVDSKPGTET